MRFTTGSEHDSQQTESLPEGLSGLFVGDAVYLLRLEVFQRLFENHKRILAASGKNMKRLMTAEQGALFRKRNIIETVWDVLKERYALEFHLARSITGLFRLYCYSLLSLMVQPFLHLFSLRLLASAVVLRGEKLESRTKFHGQHGGGYIGI